MKFKYNDIVKWHNEVGLITDSRIHNGILQYQVKLVDGTIVWTEEGHIMIHTARNLAKIGDKVSYYDNGFKYGIVVDVDYSHGFKFLVEMSNRERLWKQEGEIRVCKSK